MSSSVISSLKHKAQPSVLDLIKHELRMVSILKILALQVLNCEFIEQLKNLLNDVDQLILALIFTFVVILA